MQHTFFEFWQMIDAMRFIVWMNASVVQPYQFVHHLCRLYNATEVWQLPWLFQIDTMHRANDLRMPWPWPRECGTGVAQFSPKAHLSLALRRTRQKWSNHVHVTQEIITSPCRDVDFSHMQLVITPSTLNWRGIKNTRPCTESRSDTCRKFTKKLSLMTLLWGCECHNLHVERHNAGFVIELSYEAIYTKYDAKSRLPDFFQLRAERPLNMHGIRRPTP
jgi:hypothetical protein